MERQFLEGMKPGDTPETALRVLEQNARQPYETVWLTESWWPQRRAALLRLLGHQLSIQAACGLNDFLYRRVGFDTLHAYLSSEPPLPGWDEFAREAQRALEAARKAGARQPLAGASIPEPGWMFRWRRTGKRVA